MQKSKSTDGYSGEEIAIRVYESELKVRSSISLVAVCHVTRQIVTEEHSYKLVSNEFSIIGFTSLCCSRTLTNIIIEMT